MPRFAVPYPTVLLAMLGALAGGVVCAALARANRRPGEPLTSPGRRLLLGAWVELLDGRHYTAVGNRYRLAALAFVALFLGTVLVFRFFSKG